MIGFLKRAGGRLNKARQRTLGFLDRASEFAGKKLPGIVNTISPFLDPNTRDLADKVNQGIETSKESYDRIREGGDVTTAVETIGEKAQDFKQHYHDIKDSAQNVDTSGGELKQHITDNKGEMLDRAARLVDTHLTNKGAAM